MTGAAPAFSLRIMRPNLVAATLAVSLLAATQALAADAPGTSSVSAAPAASTAAWTPALEAIAKKLEVLRAQRTDFERPTTDLVHELAGIGTTPAVRLIVKVAGDHGGALRTEVGKTLKDLGDRAVPALILARGEPAPELRKWAATELEHLGKRIPGDAVQTTSTTVLVDVLAAYGEVHDVDALPVLLSFVNADRQPVREAAREAVGKLGQDGIWKLRETYANVVEHPAPEGATAAQVAKELFAAYDKIRLQEVYGLLETGLAAMKEKRLEDAVGAFDKVLARQPLLDRRTEMVPAYVEYATSLEDTDPPRAVALFEKARRLYPDGPRTSLIDAELAYLEGKNLAARGITDPAPFARALEKDPTHIKARSELARIEAEGDARQGRVRIFAAAIAAVLVAMVGLVLFAGRRRPRAVRA